MNFYTQNNFCPSRPATGAFPQSILVAVALKELPTQWVRLVIGSKIETGGGITYQNFGDVPRSRLWPEKLGNHQCES